MTLGNLHGIPLFNPFSNISARRNSHRWRWGMLLGYWSLQILCVVLLAGLLKILGPFQEESWLHWLAGAFLAVIFGFLASLPITASLWLGLAREVWWKRPLVAVALALSLEYVGWLFRSAETTREYWGDGSLFIWLPFGTSCVVVSLLALTGRWQTSNAFDAENSSVSSQFSLRDMFIVTAIVAACLPIGQIIYLSYVRESQQFLDGLGKLIALMLALILYPPAALVQASILRMLLGTRRPSVAIWIMQAIGLIWFLVLAGMVLYNQGPAEAQGFFLLPLGWLGFVAQAFVLGWLLRWLGYRVDSAWYGKNIGAARTADFP